MNPDFLGGAMFLFSGCSPEISHCTLSNNTAAAGGAIWCQDSSPTITNCTITDNSAQEGGGGIDVGWSNLTIDKCTLSGNSGDDGGAISIRWDSTASISNCVISGNTASDGGAVHCEDSNPTIANCTISGNTVTGEGGAISSYDYDEAGRGPTVLNTILWGDTVGGSPDEIHVDFGASISVTYSDIQGGWPGTDNIDCNPEFVDSGDYHLLASSCCIDAGTSNGAPNEDMDGEVRPHGDDYDIGADEYYPVHAGFILLDRQVYAPGVDVNILVSDSDLNTNSGDIEQYSNIIRITTAEEDIESSVTMTETGPDTGVFTGAIAVADGVAIPEDDVLEIDCQTADTITATYYDADDGTGQPATPSDTADTDCDRPGVTGVQVADRGYTTAAITWNTDESADGCVFYGTSVPQLSECQSSLVTAHTIHLTGLLPDTTYYFSVASTDEAGNQTIDDNGGQYYQLPSVLATQWAKTYGGSDQDEARSIDQTADGGYVIAGLTTSFGGGVDAWILKLDYFGTVEWEKAYGGAESDYANSIQQTADGGYIFAGHTPSAGQDWGDVWMVKLDPSGNIEWQKRYGGTGFETTDSAQFVQQTSDGGYIVSAYTSSFGAGNSDFWILRLDSIGNVIWQKTFGGGGSELVRCIRQTDNGYVVTGYSVSFGSGGYPDLWVLSLNGDGDVIWQKSYGDSEWELGNSIQQTTDGGYVVAGQTSSFTSGNDVSDLWIVKLGSDGSVTWQKAYDWDWCDEAYSIEQTPDGGYVVLGWSNDSQMDGDLFRVLKVDSNGAVLWEKTYIGSSLDSTGNIQQTPDGGYIAGGWSRLLGVGGGDFWVLKLDENGEIPSCSVMSDSTATVMETSVIAQDTSASEQIPSFVQAVTTITPQDTWAEASLLCSPAVAPVADFSADQNSGHNPFTVQFTDESIGCIDVWQWDFNNDGTFDSTDRNPSHTYTIAGDYTVSLTVTGPGGVDTETKTDYIHVSDATFIERIAVIKQNTGVKQRL
jgi:PKD repeat protein